MTRKRHADLFNNNYTRLHQKLLRACERELDSIDMSINVKKSCCMRIGVRHDKPCSKIDGSLLTFGALQIGLLLLLLLLLLLVRLG